MYTLCVSIVCACMCVCVHSSSLHNFVFWHWGKYAYYKNDFTHIFNHFSKQWQKTLNYLIIRSLYNKSTCLNWFKSTCLNWLLNSHVCHLCTKWPAFFRRVSLFYTRFIFSWSVRISLFIFSLFHFWPIIN